MLKYLNGDRLDSRIRRAVSKVSTILGLTVLMSVVCLFVISGFYDKVLVNYAFPQGDIGMAMVMITETHDDLTSAVGFTVKEDIDYFVEEYNYNKKQYEHFLSIIEPTMVTPEGHASFAKIVETSDTYWKLSDEILKEGSVTTLPEIKKAEKRILTELKPKYDDVRAALYELMEVNIQKGDEAANILAIVRIATTIIAVILSVVGVLLSVRIGRVIAKSIALPLQSLGDRFKSFAEGDIASTFPEHEFEDEVQDIINESVSMSNTLGVIIKDIDYLLSSMADGDFTVKSKHPEKYTNEFSSILKSMNNLEEQLSITLVSIKEASEQVNDGSAQLASSAQELAEGATEQAGAVEELTATIEDVNTIAADSAAAMEEAAESSKESAVVADNSRQAMEDLITAMGRITETSKEIEGIIADIEEIASQTNLLSLNASIEAARAGEAGRGFAVVADQIGKLANDSANSASNTKELITKALSEINVGNQIAESAMLSINKVLASIEEFSKASSNNAKDSRRQADMLDQIKNGIEQIASVVQNNSAASEETSAISEELSAQATQLQDMVAQFKLD